MIDYDFNPLQVIYRQRQPPPNPRLRLSPCYDDHTYTDRYAYKILHANAWLNEAAQQPPSRMLFDDFWFEHELCILFADTNIGKSVLAVQLGDSISSGKPIGSFALGVQYMPVLYFDFEMSMQQFRRRYTTPREGTYRFMGPFFRAGDNPFKPSHRFKTHEEYIQESLENAFIACKAKVIIIDNLNALGTGLTGAAGTIRLMNYLQHIKQRYKLSILLLAHTPKRNPAQPIGPNDLQGSKMLPNLADSAFAIGESHTRPGLRYLKQIKQRNAAQKYGAGNVCLCRLQRTGSFLHFAFEGHSAERLHLQPATAQQRRNTEAQIQHLHQQGYSYREISKQLQISKSTVQRVIGIVKE